MFSPIITQRGQADNENQKVWPQFEEENDQNLRRCKQDRGVLGGKRNVFQALEFGSKFGKRCRL